jgi:hypothetical protein
MTVPRPLPHLLALLLGVAAALLAACGGTSDGIPSANAGDLKSQIEDVQQAVDSGRCSDVYGQLKQVDERIDDLPPSTDPQLVRTLREGADQLRSVAIEQCDATPAETTTPAPPPVPEPPAPQPPPPAPAPPPPAGTPGGGVEPDLP